jgi:hypothetical protein
LLNHDKREKYNRKILQVAGKFQHLAKEKNILQTQKTVYFSAIVFGETNV